MTNAEKYKHAEERAEAFRKFCNKHICRTCPLIEFVGREARCCFHWLTLKYEEEIKPCPFCGGEKISTLVLHGAERKLRCNECGAQTAVFTDEKAMIDSWNRRVK